MRKLPVWRWALLLALVLVAVPSLGETGELQIEITNPEGGAQLVLGDMIDINVAIRNLSTDPSHRIWFSLRIRRASWGEDAWVALPTAERRESGPTSFPSRSVRGSQGSWNGMAVVWDTSRPFPRQETEDPFAEDDPYYIQIGVVESIHDTTDESRMAWSPEVALTFKESPDDVLQEVEEPAGPVTEDERGQPLSIGVHLKPPPHFAGESIAFKILVPESPGDVYQSFLWDFGDGARSVEAAPVHRYETQGTYHVRLTAWSQPNHEGDTIDSNELQIVVLPPAPAVRTTRRILGFPSSLDATSATRLLPGFELQVQLSIVINDPSKAYAFVVRERIPNGWTIPGAGMTSSVSEGLEGRTRETQATAGSTGIAWREWLFRGPFTKGETIVVNYVLSPDADAPLGRYELAGDVSVGTSETRPVEGGSEVVLVLSLPVEVVIAHIDRATASMDCVGCPSQEAFTLEPKPFARSGAPYYTISSEQLDFAVCLWSNNCTVPYTGGQTITYTKLLELIERCTE